MNRTFKTWWVRITTNPQKASLLAALLVILAVMGIRVALRSGPNMASAGAGDGSERSASARVNKALDNNLLEQGGAPVSILRSGPLERNVFTFDEDHFPSPPPPVQEDRGNSGKSGSKPPESQTEKELTPEEKRERLVREAKRAFTLQSTLVGAKPIAVIQTHGSGGRDRQMLSVGQELRGFVLREVLAHAIVVEKDGIRIEIRRELPER